MVDTQVRPSDVTKFPIIDAMLQVPREAFVPESQREAAYIGENLDIGGGRTLLEPRSFAKMIDALNIEPSDVVLDIGSGYGYSTAVLAKMCDFVVGLEDDESRAEEAQAILSQQGADNAASVFGALADGAAKSGPYDVIIIQGSVEEIPPALIAQLRDGGKIAAIFSEGALGVVRIGQKRGEAVNWRFSFNASAPVLPGFEKEASFAL